MSDLFPDPVALVLAYLRPIVDPVQVLTRVPNPRPDTLVQVRLIGGITDTVRDIPRLDVFAWAPTEPDATTLGLTVREAMWALAGTALLGPVCYQVSEFMGPRMDDDDETGTPRHWTTYQLAIRADGLIYRAP